MDQGVGPSQFYILNPINPNDVKTRSVLSVFVSIRESLI